MTLCRCGCGKETDIARVTRTSSGISRGDPLRFRRGHNYWRKDIDTMYEVDASTGCWNWTGNIEWGYGRIGQRLAYCVFYERAKGPKPKGLELDHLCRNRRCVNPEHLQPVTRAENVRRGLSTKLSVDKVLDIRRLYLAGATNVSIAARFGISTSQASRIRHGENWKLDARAPIVWRETS